MQTNNLRKIVILSLLLLVISVVIILVWSIGRSQSTEDRESNYTSGKDAISGEAYSNTPTGGDSGTSLAVLGLTNLSDNGMNANDVETVRQYISHLMITKYDKKIDDIVSISKDNIDFTVGKDAIDTTYSFRVYLNSNEYIRGELVTPLKNDTVDSRKIIFYNEEGDQIHLYEI